MSQTARERDGIVGRLVSALSAAADVAGELKIAAASADDQAEGAAWNEAADTVRRAIWGARHELDTVTAVVCSLRRIGAKP